MVGQTNCFPPHEFHNSYLYDYKLPYAKSTINTYGHDLMKRAYEEAIKEEYKFYSTVMQMLIIYQEIVIHSNRQAMAIFFYVRRVANRVSFTTFYNSASDTL
jgi:hypothetical protein